VAQRTGFTTKHINLLLKGDAPITQDTAMKLEKVLGSTARFWLGLEAQGTGLSQARYVVFSLSDRSG